MTIRVRTICFIAIPLLLASIPAQAEEFTMHGTSILMCGNINLTTKTTYLINPNYPDFQVSEQTVTWADTKTNQTKDIKTDNRYVIKHMPEERRVLDTAIEMMRCIKSKQGKYYLYFFYGCPSGEETGFCAQGRVEFERVLNENGSKVIKEPRKWKIYPSYINIYKRLGLYDAINNKVGTYVELLDDARYPKSDSDKQQY